MQNTRLTFPCFFLHDSLMAAFQEEQTFFRQKILTSGKELPFSIIPPLCPCPNISGNVSPEIGPISTDSGWILHPVKALSPSDCVHDCQPLSPDAVLPGYPAFPRTTGFILGYAGDMAAELVSRVCPATEKLPKTPFSVKFWYQANIMVECVQDLETGSISAQWTIGEKIR